MTGSDLVELRCKYCGAPLDKKDVESDSPYVTCPSCGTTQQRLDAKAYMDQMMGQIQSWISKAIPGGFSLAQQENVDPIARHSIFMNNVKPVIDVEIRDFRFAFNGLLASPLVVLPFCKGDVAKAKHTSSQAFEFNAKLKSIEPLAIDSVNKGAITEAENISSAYALIVNNTKLFGDTTPGRFILMAKNFAESADALKKCSGMEPLESRLSGLSEVCTASDMVLNGDVMGCRMKAESAIAKLEKARKDILMNPRLAMMIRAVDLELNQSRTLMSIAEKDSAGGNGDSLKTLETVSKISEIRYPANREWSPLLNRKERENELNGYMDQIAAAKNGGTLPICTGDGNLLYPFWDIDLMYSFTTGSMFKKKSVEVEEDILIPATFTMSAEALSNPRHGLTDIFANANEGNFMDRVKGLQDSISGGKGIGRITDSATENRVGGRSVVVPVSTKMEATKLVEGYLRQCTANMSQLRLSKPYVRRLVYIPCKMENGRITLPSAFEGAVPASMNDREMSSIIII